MEVLRAKSLALTGYLAALLQSELSEEVKILTPLDAPSHGSQLSLVFERPVRAVYEALSREGIIGDMREVRTFLFPKPATCARTTPPLTPSY